MNATPIGLYPEVSARVPVEIGSIDLETIVCDVIPNPPRTPLIAEAERRGCRVLDGLGMLVNQGAIAIKIWSGQQPDSAVMGQALRDVFSIERDS